MLDILCDDTKLMMSFYKSLVHILSQGGQFFLHMTDTLIILGKVFHNALHILLRCRRLILGCHVRRV